MIIYYFGADQTWEELKEVGFNRRNTYILKSLINDGRISKVYNIRKVRAATFFSHIRKTGSRDSGKIVDVLYSPLVPTWLGPVSNLNKFIFRSQIFIQQRHHKRKRLIWCYWPNAFRQVKELGIEGEILFDADHNIIDDPNLDAESSDQLKLTLKQITRKAKWIISASPSMNKWFEEAGFPEVHRLRNGVELERFNSEPLPQGLKSKIRMVGYVGTLSRWIDQELLLKLIEVRPNYTFLIVGSDFKTDLSKEISTKSNVLWLGKQPANKVPELMKQMKVGLSLYKKRPGLDADSMKIYEYLAAGLPVVSTNYHEDLTEDFQDLLFLANSFEEYIHYLDEIMNDTINVHQENLTEFIKKSSWQSRVSNFLTAKIIKDSKQE